MFSLSDTRLGPPLWIGAAAVILAADYLTGPYIQFSILYVVPVVIATVGSGLRWGLLLAVLLPGITLALLLPIRLVGGLTYAALDVLIDVAALTAFALFAERVVRQAREIRVLRGMLPICGFCKRIRSESGEWHGMEQYITERSSATFSHTFCPDCGRKHYGKYGGT